MNKVYNICFLIVFLALVTVRSEALNFDFEYGMGYSKLKTAGMGGIVDFDEGIQSKSSDLSISIDTKKYSFDFDFHTSSGLIPIASDLQNNDPQIKYIRMILGIFGIKTVYSRSIWGSTGYSDSNDPLIYDMGDPLNLGDPIDFTLTVDKLGIVIIDNFGWGSSWMHFSMRITGGLVLTTSGGYEYDFDNYTNAENVHVVYDRTSWGIGGNGSWTMRFGEKGKSKLLIGFGPETDLLMTGTIVMGILGYHLDFDWLFYDNYSLGFSMAGGLFGIGSRNGFFIRKSDAESYKAFEQNDTGITYFRIAFTLKKSWDY